jgi:hypothetical protein
MADLELLKQLRAAGVKAVDFHYDGQAKTTNIIAVEFFPPPLPGLETFDVGAALGTGHEAETERPDAGDDVPTVNIAPAMKRVLSRGSVS